MEEVSSHQFPQWATNTNTLQHHHPAAAVGGRDDRGERLPSRPSERSARSRTQPKYWSTSRLGKPIHAANGWSSVGGDATSNNLPAASWSFFGATSAARPAGGNGMTGAAATQVLPDLVDHGGSRATRRAGVRTMGSMPSSYAQDHIIAERKRREKINQRFIELSTVIPGLKKMDKATILSDATRHVKELQEQLKELEAGGGGSSSWRSIEHLKRPCFHGAASPDDEDSPLSASPGTPQARNQLLPEIEAQFSENSVMVRIHCDNSKGVVVRLLTEVEALHLSIVDANVMPFTACTLIVTITAKVEGRFTITAEEIIGRLNSALPNQLHSNYSSTEEGNMN